MNSEFINNLKNKIEKLEIQLERSSSDSKGSSDNRQLKQQIAMLKARLATLSYGKRRSISRKMKSRKMKSRKMKSRKMKSRKMRKMRKR